MRVLRRCVQIITLLVVFVVPGATAHASATSSDAREPWATVNVCDTAKSPDTIGVRASMPGSRHGLHERYMRFVVQYYSRADERWKRVTAGGDSGFLSVGKGRGVRQLGRSFRVQPAAGQPVLLRGRVFFQWRLKGVVVRRAQATTRKGYRSSAGDDPRGYSAATCTITSDS